MPKTDKSPIKVGQSVLVDKKTKKNRKVGYADVRYDADMWADSSKFLPADFDLVYMKSPSHIKIIPGWINGRTWDGLNLLPDEVVSYWKKHD